MTDDMNEADAEKALAASEGHVVSGGFDGPAWAPMLDPKWHPDLRPEAQRQKLEKRGKGSSWASACMGRLAIARAWGRPLYFIIVKGVRTLLPEHKGLYRDLDMIEEGAMVAIRLDGRGPQKTPGRQAPWRFSVKSVDKPLLAEPRKNGPKAMSMDEREAARAARDPKRVHDDMDDAGAYDDPDAL